MRTPHVVKKRRGGGLASPSSPFPPRYLVYSSRACRHDAGGRAWQSQDGTGEGHERAVDARRAGEASRSSRCRPIRTPTALRRSRAQLAGFPPLVFAGEARKLKRALGQGRGRRGFPAPGRRLRRELRRAFGRQHPRFLPRLPADGGGADLRRRLAGGEGRPHRRPVRQAALGADRDDRRRRAAELPRRHHQRHRLHAARRACPIRAASSRPTGSRRRRSTCSAPSRPAATPTSRTRIAGCSAS